MKQNKKQYQNRMRRAGAQSAAHAKRTGDKNTSMWEWQQCLLPTVLINRALKQTENSLRLSAGLGIATHTFLHKHTFTHCFYQANNPGNQILHLDITSFQTKNLFSVTNVNHCVSL